MAETLIENQVCSTCGTAVRPNAQFCYNCGAAVAEDAPPEQHEQKNKPARKTKLKENNGKTVADLLNQPQEIEAGAKPKADADVKLKSAASLRNKARRLEPKKVEIIWEEHENAPNLWFIAVAVLLVIFSVIIYFIAMNLK